MCYENCDALGGPAGHSELECLDGQEYIGCSKSIHKLIQRSGLGEVCKAFLRVGADVTVFPQKGSVALVKARLGWRMTKRSRLAH